MNDQIKHSPASDEDQPFDGVFVESAYTIEQIQAAQAEESRLGGGQKTCAFLSEGVKKQVKRPG